MLAVFERITPSLKLKKPFDGMTAGEINALAQTALAKYPDQLNQATRLQLGGSLLEQIKGLRSVSQLESRLMAKFCHDNFPAALDFVLSHGYFAVLCRQDITVQLKLSSPDLSYLDLVGMAQRLEQIERERQQIPAPKSEPSRHRGRRIKRRHGQTA